jgi:hypothetical protein
VPARAKARILPVSKQAEPSNGVKMELIELKKKNVGDAPKFLSPF